MGSDPVHSPLEDLFSDDIPEREQRDARADEAADGASHQHAGLSPADLFSSKRPDEPVAVQGTPSRQRDERCEAVRQSGMSETCCDMPESALRPQGDARSDTAADDRQEKGRADHALDGQQRIAQERQRILNILLAGSTIGGGLVILVLGLNGIQTRKSLLSYVPFLVGYVLVVLACVLRRAPRGWRTATLIGVSYAIALLSAWENGPIGTAPWYLLSIPLLFFVLVSVRASIVSGLINSLVYVAIAGANHVGWLRVRTPIVLEASLSQSALVGITFVLITAIMVMVQVLFTRAQRETRHALEAQRVALGEAHAHSAQRQQDLERANITLRRHTEHFDLSVEVGRLAATGLAVEEFVDQAVSLILDRVGAHYVGLFVLNEERTHAQLEAVAGLDWDTFSPEQMRMAVKDDILLQQCVDTARPRVLLGIDHVRSLSQDGSGSLVVLKATQSALALPLIARGGVFGVITIQSRSPAAYRNEDLFSLEGVANQIATAISNARLAQELQTRIQAMEILQKYYVKDEWEEFLESHDRQWYEYAQPGVSLSQDRPMPAVHRVLSQPELTVLAGDGAATPSALLSPISLRDQVLGVLGFEHIGSEAEWTNDQIETVTAVARQLGLIIENSRLFAEAQSRAARERKVRDMTSRIRRSLDVDTILRTAAYEMGEALDLQDITVCHQVGGGKRTWKDQLGDIQGLAYRYVNGELLAIESPAESATLQTRSNDQDLPGLRLPIIVRDELIGTIDAHKAPTSGTWTAEELEIAEAVTEQLGTALDSARLYQDSQRRVMRERLLADIGARMRETLDLEGVLQVAVQEIAEAFDLAEVEVRMRAQDTRDAVLKRSAARDGSKDGKE
jgi:GAF domain-containing protein